jgi:hypothetical protein
MAASRFVIVLKPRRNTGITLEKLQIFLETYQQESFDLYEIPADKSFTLTKAMSIEEFMKENGENGES